jgi:hypothetical protein
MSSNSFGVDKGKRIAAGFCGQIQLSVSTAHVSERRRRNFLRRAERLALYRAWQHGERYCSTCGDYREPDMFSGSDPRTCDHCRGFRHCRRCRQDQPVTAFGSAHTLTPEDDTCQTERAAFDAFLATEERDDSASSDHGVTLGRDPCGRRVRLPAALRDRHLHIIGKPGAGGTALMKNLFFQDMAAGHGCAFVDLQGDLALDLLGLVPPSRLPVVTYFAPATGHGPAFNPLALPYAPQVVAEDMIEVFKLFFTAVWEPQLEQLLRFGLLTLLADRAPHTLADLYTFYVAPPYRGAIADASPSPRLRAFWQHEFHKIESDAIGRIASTLAAFLTPLSPLERLLSTAQNGLDFEALMDGRHIFIANLNRNALGPEPARLLGALLIRAIARAAPVRAVGAHDERPGFFVYLPEFQDYADFGFNTLLCTGAHTQLNVTFAHGSLEELPTALADAILASVGTTAAFEVSPDDATRLKPTMRARRLARASTAEIYDHDAVCDAAAAPLRACVRQLLATPRVFADEEQPNYEGARVAALLADIDRMRNVPPPDDLAEIEWPTLDDFTQRTPLTALVRVERPDQVTALAVDAPPAPDAHTRAAILDRPHRRELPPRSDTKSATSVPHAARDGHQAPRRRRRRRAFRTLRRPAR